MTILNEWIKLYKGEDGCGITSESAIFVCNKWDEVKKQSNRNQEEDPERKTSTLSGRIFPNWMKNSKSLRCQSLEPQK